MGRAHAQVSGTVPDCARIISPAPDWQTLVPDKRRHYPACLKPIEAPVIVPGRLSHPGFQGSRVCPYARPVVGAGLRPGNGLLSIIHKQTPVITFDIQPSPRAL